MSLLTAYGSVNGYIIKQMDRFAKMKKTIKDTLDAYTSYRFWVLVDAANDETYENRVKGTSITNLDSKLNEAKIGSLSQDWFTLHTSYFSQDLGLNGISGYLDKLGIRVHEDFGNVYFESSGTRLAAKYVWADQEKSTNVVYDTVNSIGPRSLPSILGDTRVSITGGGTITSITFGDTFGNSTALTGSLLPPTDGSAHVGESIVSSISVGDEIITLDNIERTACFKVNQYVMVQSTFNTDLYEIIKLHATTTPNSITGVLTLASGTSVRYNYSTGAKVWPLFNKVITATVSSGNIIVKPVDDRIIAWG